MFAEFVEIVVEKMHRGHFRIGLEPIKRHVLFWCMANYLQEQQKSGKISIVRYASRTFPLAEEGSKEQKLEMLDRNAYYERKLDHYNTMNLEKKVELLLRQKLESKQRMMKQANNENLEGNAQRYQGLSLFPYQLEEFAVLDGIKEGNATGEMRKTYKRMVSEKGYLKKMTFKEYKSIVSFLKDEIAQSQDPHTNIRSYKLEKRLGFQAVKAVLKAIKDCREQEKWPVEIVIRDLTYVLRLPLLAERQQYAAMYPDLTWEDRKTWGMDVLQLYTFTEECTKEAKFVLDQSKGSMLKEGDWELFKTLYLPESFENDYKQRKDFNAADFTLLMADLDQQTTSQLEKIRKKIEE